MTRFAACTMDSPRWLAVDPSNAGRFSEGGRGLTPVLHWLLLLTCEADASSPLTGED